MLHQVKSGLFLGILVVAHLALASDSPEPSKKKGEVPDDPVVPSHPSETPIAIHPPHGSSYPETRLGSSDDDNGEVDDGESEIESESGGSSSVNARPAKSGGATATSVEISIEAPAAPAPPEPEPPLVVVGEPVAPVIAQLQHRDKPFYGHRLFPYHQKSARQQFCCAGKFGSPYSVPVGVPSKSSISQVQLVSVSAPALQIVPNPPAVPANIVNEKLIQTVSITAPVQPNRILPSAAQEKVFIGKQVVSSPSTYPVHVPQYPQYPVAFSSHQKVFVDVPSRPAPTPPQPAPTIEKHTLAKQIVSVHNEVHTPHPAPPVPSQLPVVKQVQIVAPPPQPAPAYPLVSPAISKQLQIVSVSSSHPQPQAPSPVQEKVIASKQVQNVAVSNQIYPVQHPNPSSNQLQLVSLSSSINKHANIYPQNPGKLVYSPQTNMMLASSAYGPSPSHGLPGYRILTPSLLPYHPHGNAKYRIADIYSPLVGSLVPALPNPKPVVPGAPNVPASPANSVSQIQQTNVHYGQHPEPAYPPPPSGSQVVRESSQVISVAPGEPTAPAPVQPTSPVPAPYAQPPPQFPQPHPYPPVHPSPEYPPPVPVPNIHASVPNQPHYPASPHNPLGTQSAFVSQNEVSIHLDYHSPACAQESGTPYCVSDPVYPTAEINAYIAMYPEKYELLRPMVPWKVLPQTPAQSPAAAEKPAPGGPAPASEPPLDQPVVQNSGMCVSHSNPSAKLLRAVNEQNKWKCVVHMADSCQISHLDICDTNRTCRYVDHLVQTQCAQEYVLQQLMVYSPEYGIHLDHMKVPQGCKCRISDPHPTKPTYTFAPEPTAAAAASSNSGAGSASGY